MGLQKYHQKRNFQQTSEPKGQAHKQGPKIFVVQRHAASRLHLDFRLELQGVLKSWAVPKGPSLDPKIKRLAVEVEDHPIEYATFEGTIPEKQYGAGEVTIWDHGTWEPPPHPVKDLIKGHIRFKLHGDKLKGEWQLIRTKKEERQPQWILMKIKDQEAKSVNQTINFTSPQLATLVTRPPEGEQWVHEIKYDGYRTLVRLQDEKVTCWTRSGLDWTEKYQSLVPAFSHLKARSFLLDGEVVCLNENGQTDFALLQKALKEGANLPLFFYAFDLLELDGRNFKNEPLSERKKQLRALIKNQKKLLYSEEVKGRGNDVLKEACRLGLEGIVSKRHDSPYISGRGNWWLKIKCANLEEFVVGGFSEGQGARSDFGALLLGSYDTQGQLVYRGRVGTGFNDKSLKEAHRQLLKLKTKTSPFQVANPREKGIHWVKPQLVAQISFRGWTHDQLIRQGSFKAWRDDKAAKDVQTAPPLPTVTITNQDKVLYPKIGITKGQIASYYQMVAPFMLPSIAQRPLAIIRCPNNIEQECFFQKRLTQETTGVQMSEIHTHRGVYKLIWIEDEIGLMSLVQLGTIEFHTWQAKVTDIDYPDQIILDLDPHESVPWAEVRQAAFELKEIVEGLGLKSEPKITGGKGIHLHIPIPRADWEQTKMLAKNISTVLKNRHPSDYILKATKAQRTGRIFIDYLRNGFGATAIAPFSLRAKEGAPVAMPMTWQELARVRSPQAWDLRKVCQALKKGLKPPVWA